MSPKEKAFLMPLTGIQLVEKGNLSWGRDYFFCHFWM
jgi:hypothetical protein